MYRPNNPRFNAPPGANRRKSFEPRHSWRAPEDFKRNVPPPPHGQSKDAGKSNQPQAPTLPSALKKTFGPEVNKWKSSFTVVGEDDKDTKTSSDKGSSPDKPRSHLYDPYESIKSDSDDHPSPEPPEELQTSCGRWDIDASAWRHMLSSGASLDSEPTERARYNSGNRTTEHRVEDYRPEIVTTVRLSPPPLLPHQQPPPPIPPPQKLPQQQPPQQLPSERDYKESSGFSGPDLLPPPRPEVKDPGKNELLTDKNLISCDLCEVEVSNGQELEEHLDSKTHWDTLEFIQKHNNYDDMAIAFLQDVMLYKSRKCSRAMEETALQALQEYDHMTKVEMFHCAACNAFVPTSASAVQSHITTQGHIDNTKEFKDRQRRLCLDKANTMMKELTPQFQSFIKGVSPFE
ncbi:hypothetical protein NL108_009601 [Boleophthalmus pectinirostris]|uniref:zinc finger RNA-binding protein 2 n=1 Tax=Boleophthalmus pectinirostris TaxID=150288 RepID=UPI000A1C4CB9|nr:zinc finger RNA-binding protein 2 [Boleophthalmus pectinirostris]KAJ0059231.1 hypothetical protein NL108_009601 [Boleophthalmus pectinirostris]